MKKRSKEEKREEKEEKKGRKIPLRNYTKGGRKSSVIAGVNILLFILAVVISILKKGNAGIYVGLLMLLVMVSAIAGFVIGINSFKEENKFLKYTYRLLFFKLLRPGALRVLVCCVLDCRVLVCCVFDDCIYCFRICYF